MVWTENKNIVIVFQSDDVGPKPSNILVIICKNSLLKVEMGKFLLYLCTIDVFL